MRTPALIAVLFLLGLSACYPGEKQFDGPTASRMHADWLPPHSLRLVQVVDLATREDIEKVIISPSAGLTIYQNLKAADIPEREIHDGSVGSGIVFCCGGDISKDTFVMFYIPEGLQVGPRDIVEVNVGDPLREDNLGSVPNVATQVRQKDGENAGCRWEPENPYLWARVLYCQGMKEEGWVQATKKVGIEALWYRPQQPQND